MDSDKPAPKKKLRFAPKPQNRRNTRSTAQPKTEKVEEDVDAEARQQLLQLFNQNRQRQQPKAENKSSVRVTFTNDAKQLTFGVPRDDGRKISSEMDLMQLDDGIGQSSKASSSTAAVERTKNKQYRDPWDYTTYFPTTLPWRMPNSGNPDILDKAEFGEVASEQVYDENAVNAASELGFLKECDDDRLLFFQFPKSLPAMKEDASAKGKEIAGSPPSSNPKDSAAFRRNGQPIRIGASAKGKGKEIAGSLPPSNPRDSAAFRRDGQPIRTGASAKGKEIADSLPPSNPRDSAAVHQDGQPIGTGALTRPCGLRLAELPAAGQMGKLLVYKSGAVKLKLGETLFNVSPGLKHPSVQNVAAINTKERAFTELGCVEGRAIVTPDHDDILDSEETFLPLRAKELLKLT